MRHIVNGLAVISVLVFAGCAGVQYVTPGAAANLEAIDNAGIKERFQTKPAAPFPARIAVVRIQQSGYYSYGSSSYGEGNYSVVTARDVEKDEPFAQLASLDQVAGLAAINRLLLPVHLNSVQELQKAAASLHADMLLLYTFDTSFRIKGQDIGPLAVITLGFLPNKKAYITTTASAVLYDVRTGYVYGQTEATQTTDHLASTWSKEKVIDNARLETEKEAFSQLIDQFCQLWPNILKEYAGADAASSGAP